MTPPLKKSAQLSLGLAILYRAYLVKTLMGINISNQYSASEILKAPLQPFVAHKAELCTGLPSLCSWRHQVRDQVQDRINQVKHLKSA